MLKCFGNLNDLISTHRQFSPVSQYSGDVVCSIEYGHIVLVQGTLCHGRLDLHNTQPEILQQLQLQLHELSTVC